MVRPQRLQKQPAFYRLLFVVCLTIGLLVASPWVSAKEKPKPQLHDWQINGILAALDDGYPGVKQTAFKKLVEFDAEGLAAFPKQSNEVVQKAIDLLKDIKEDSNLRISAVEALSSLGKADASVVQSLTTLVNNSKEDSNLRISAAEALSSLGKADASVVQSLTTLINDSKDNFDIRIGAAKVLSSLGKTDASVVQFLTTLLNSSKDNSTIRLMAINALGSLGKADASVVQSLTTVVNDSKDDSNIRTRAVEALGVSGKADASVMRSLTTVVSNSKEDSDLRARAVDALGSLGKADASVMRSLTTVVSNSKEDSGVRGSAVDALGSLGKGDASVVQFLTTLVNNSKEDSNLRISAVDALGSLGKGDASVVQFLTTLVNNSKEDSNLRISAAEALSSLGKADASVVQSLTTLVNDSKEDDDLRFMAFMALSSLGKADASVVQFLTTLVNDSRGDDDLRISRIGTLGSLGKADTSVVQSLTTLVNNSKEDSYARGKAVEALGSLGKGDASVVQSLTTLVNNSEENDHLRISAAEALGTFNQLNLSESFVLIDRIDDFSTSGIQEMRFSCYFYSRGDSKIKTLLKWIGRPDSKSIPTQLTHAEAKETLEVFRDAWELSQNFGNIRTDLPQKIADVAKMGKWETGDIALLNTHYQNLSAIKSNSADSVNKAIESLTVWQWFSNAKNMIAAHAAFWLALIFAYPKFPQVQAIFFWNPWVRRILGVGYVGFLLTWVPFLRRKLFEPFQFSLLADSGVDRFNPAAYFPESDVKPLDAKESVPLTTAIPAIQGQIVLEGDSGLGKSMFLRHLVKYSPRTVVFLPARKCEQGVIEAIQTKLHGQAQDAEFLKNLIYSGAIDLCIDGLNEVTADTRAKITQFVESYFKGNIIMTTQPLEWLPPATAKIYQLQPLRSDQIQEFLLSRQAIVAPDLADKYTYACCTYLDDVLSDRESPEELAAIQRTLSNPMDLTVVAQMIALGKQPNLLRLQEQQYTLMAAEYQQHWNQDFPLKKFSEAVYQLRLNDEKALSATEFYQELVSMEDEKYKMVVSRQWKDSKGEAQHEWYFRHDKIMEFFIVQTFLGDATQAQNRLLDHMGDPRFRGVYFLLATLLPLGDAKDLRERLIQYAADTKDHTVSDTFVQLLRTR